jgi:ABC-2 type transport system permease protein
MKRILAQCQKELNQFRRDRLTVALAFVLPILTLFIFGFAIRLEAKDIPLAVQDFDNTPLSRAYIERLYANEQFTPVGGSDRQTAQQILDNSEARAVVIIPPEFSRHLAAKLPTDVQVLVDGSDVNNARIIKNSIKATTQFFLRTSDLQSPPVVAIHPNTRIWFNPGRKESLYIVPGTCAVILWIYPSLLAAIALVREKEQGTIVQVYASNLSAVELLLGKALAYLLVGLSEGALVILLSVILFRLHFAGDPTPFLVGTPIFVGTSVVFGLLIGTRVHDQNAAVQAVALAGFLTALLLSGFIYPVSNIPFPLSLISSVVPTRYYINIIRDAFVRGTGWSGVWPSVLILIGLGCVFFNVARRNLQRMQLPG